ncbi:pseudaminic acid biosynthesis N-acetyl transferase [Desulfosporosinus orientis DSM 765]|uniref:Pseudaminic acid biosynthesis N-acetyl transferase n=1 Tax=Desulfosporosinus orientis (strain ATCC 19365 / DSM 765 / NCIMB 8382 / VKM B-1628 / Singapore I) TaxID=768706 RepID=G7WI08_DESOD|nr:UDP-4-amino-4,6-dideoxy-N-acetyl-beta-L-altrosamine N-acetyltransferase [Desulfosporosinus orientis]AET70305.1 pseudaminic acid biosynthesis N-acetyl transferase [Desulfosporosinus orientis DSM 765]
MLETKRLLLRLLNEQDENDIVKWRNQKDIINSLFSYKGVTITEHRQWFDKYSRDDTRIEYVICKKEDGKKIGTIGLSSIDHKNQKAEYGILIGEAQEQKKGFALEASYTLLKYAFYDLNLHKIKLHVFTDNNIAINLYKRLGFKEEGTLHQEIYKNSGFKDVLVMGLLKEEWVGHD